MPILRLSGKRFNTSTEVTIRAHIIANSLPLDKAWCTAGDLRKCTGADPRPGANPVTIVDDSGQLVSLYGESMSTNAAKVLAFLDECMLRCSA